MRAQARAAPSDARSAERAFCVSTRAAPVSTTSSDPARPESPRAETPRPATLEDRIRVLADEAAEDSGVYIVGVSVKGHPGSRLVEVFCDGDGAGIDELAGLTRRLNVLLDTEDPVAGRYRLDVSTPGADRPLVDARQYPQHVGRTLRVLHATDAGGEAETTGVLTAATADEITVEPPGAPPVVVVVSRLREAFVVLPW